MQGYELVENNMATVISGSKRNVFVTNGVEVNSAPSPASLVDICLIYIYNCNWVDARWQQYSSHLHTNNTQNTENGTHITITKLNAHNNKKN
jgi:hypothetical protein